MTLIGILFIFCVIGFLLWINKKENQLFPRYETSTMDFLRKKYILLTKLRMYIEDYKNGIDTPYTDYQVDYINALEYLYNSIRDCDSTKEIMDILYSKYHQEHHINAINDIESIFRNIWFNLKLEERR